MKNKTEKSRIHVEQALRNLPQDFALRGIRNTLRRALNEIDDVEKKKNKRNKEEVTPWQKWQMDLSTGRLVPPNMSEQQQKDTLTAIDNLISAEEEKLKEKQNQSTNQPSGLFFG